jgi:hypothetical protein
MYALPFLRCHLLCLLSFAAETLLPDSKADTPAQAQAHSAAHRFSEPPLSMPAMDAAAHISARVHVSYLQAHAGSICSDDGLATARVRLQTSIQQLLHVTLPRHSHPQARQRIRSAALAHP